MKIRCKSGPCNTTCAIEPFDALGPHPTTAVATLADLGLTDLEIARYFRIPAERITRVRLKFAPELQSVGQSDAVSAFRHDRE